MKKTNNIFVDDSDNIALSKVKKLPNKPRGFKRELAQMYLSRDPVKRIVASILHSAHLHNTNCFILSKRLIENLVAVDPNVETGSNVRYNYGAVGGLLAKKFGIYIKLNKAASVWFLNKETLDVLEITGDAFLFGCVQYMNQKGIADAKSLKKLQELQLPTEFTSLSITADEALDAQVAVMIDMYGPEIASWEQYLLDMPKNERLILLERAMRATNAH